MLVMSYRTLTEKHIFLQRDIDKLNSERTESALSEKRLNEIDAELKTYKREKIHVETQISKIQSDIEDTNEQIIETRPLKEVLQDPHLRLNTKLAELFRRNGVAIATLATALGLVIITLGIAIGVNKSSTTATDSNATWLQTLAERSVAIVSFVFKIATAAVGFVREYLWVFLTGLTLYKIGLLI